MVRIAICDDEKEDVTLHEKIIKDSLQSCGIGYEITTYTYSRIDAFELSIFRYVPKSDFEKRLKTAVADAAKLIELEEGKEYIIQAAGRVEKIPYKDIFYIQCDGGKNSVQEFGDIGEKVCE